MFNLVNVAQWRSIIIAINVLMNTGRAEWVTATIILIVGLHFFPLAATFKYGPHYMDGRGARAARGHVYQAIS